VFFSHSYALNLAPWAAGPSPHLQPDAGGCFLRIYFAWAFWFMVFHKFLDRGKVPPRVICSIGLRFFFFLIAPGPFCGAVIFVGGRDFLRPSSPPAASTFRQVDTSNVLRASPSWRGLLLFPSMLAGCGSCITRKPPVFSVRDYLSSFFHYLVSLVSTLVFCVEDVFLDDWSGLSLMLEFFFGAFS